MAAGDEVFQESDAAQPCAVVVQAAADASGEFDAIVSGQITALQSQPLHLGGVTGARITLELMPYPLLEDI